ncbi:MAG: ATP-dependent RNA helicase HrpA [Rhodanobacteraceae bacterium]|nr:ATP-dependent RNA helicase HrpA [Rhodanobacteraceae bacterium]
MNPILDELYRELGACLLIDQPRLRRRLHAVRSYLERQHAEPGRPPPEESLARLRAEIGASRARVEQRRAQRPDWIYPEALPVSAQREQIAAAIAAHPVIVLCGATGSGKSTQLPKICLEAGRGVTGMIGHTQPRRIAARSLAARIASEMKVELGQRVGYKVRFGDHTRPETVIKLMTDGILLAELLHDRRLLAYDTLIIDEAHERSLNIDFLLGYLKQLLPQRPDLKIIITSATIDPERFARHFDGAPILEVSGRTYPVEVRYRPPGGDGARPEDDTLQQRILDATDELSRQGPGDILIFLPGERHIRETAEALRKHHPPHIEIIPLYARLSAAEQGRIFREGPGRRIILATNIAETSLTVPGIRYVIDTGLARISRYSHRSKVQRLPVEAIARSAADQRAGRCGRVAPGICIRLYAEEDYLARPAHTLPEILRTNLASVILQMQVLQLGEIEQFPFIDPPDARYVNDGYKLLLELNALDGQRRLTDTGRKIAQFPVDPRIGRMLLGGVSEHCLAEALVICAALSLPDPRERPAEAQQAADEKHRLFQDPRSDFLGYLKLWAAFEEQARHLSQNKLRKYCQEHFLSYRRLREWRDIHQQLHEQLADMGCRLNMEPADYNQIHRALLAGLLGNVARLNDEREYVGAWGNKFVPFPGSVLAKKPPRWLTAAELTEPHRLYAHTAARIEPEWIEQAAAHLVKRSHYDPFWDARRRHVMVYERVTLYGLVINPRRCVDYAGVDPDDARAIFIRCALLEEEEGIEAACLVHNRALIGEIRALEDKTRHRGLLVDDETLFRFYAERLPPGMADGRSFEAWYKAARRDEPRLLFMEKDLLLRKDAGAGMDVQYPAHLEMNGVKFPLHYRFEPGAADDGVTLEVPLMALNQVDAERTEWLVPGLLPEKLVALIKSLPKTLRRRFVPASDFAAACVEALRSRMRGNVTAAVAAELQRMTGTEVPPESWRPEELPAHLRMNFRIVDEHGAALAAGRDLARLRAELGERARRSFSAGLQQDGAGRRSVAWDFGPLPVVTEIERNGVRMQAYPVLQDEGDAVAWQWYDDARRAEQANRAGIRRLVLLALSAKVKYLKKEIPALKTMCAHYLPLGNCGELQTQLVEAAVDQVFLSGRPLPRSEEEFRQRLAEGASALVAAFNELCRLAADILAAYHEIRRALAQEQPPACKPAIADMTVQLEYLVYGGFLRDVPPDWLRHYPRYLKAMRIRLDRLRTRPEKDAQLLAEIGPLWQKWLRESSRGADIPASQDIPMRWLLEELRVSLFAQELKTLVPVSAQRLQRVWPA